jgi:hypothetical protein
MHFLGKREELHDIVCCMKREKDLTEGKIISDNSLYPALSSGARGMGCSLLCTGCAILLS